MFSPVPVFHSSCRRLYHQGCPQCYCCCLARNWKWTGCLGRNRFPLREAGQLCSVVLRLGPTKHVHVRECQRRSIQSKTPCNSRLHVGLSAQYITNLAIQTLAFLNTTTTQQESTSQTHNSPRRGKILLGLFFVQNLNGFNYSGYLNQTHGSKSAHATSNLW